MSRLKILEAYLQVASLGSVTAAAKHLGVSQPSVSRMIQELERDLGQPLFERVGQRLVLTPKGMVLRDDVERALAGFVNLWERAREVVGEADRTAEPHQFRTPAAPVVGEVVQGAEFVVGAPAPPVRQLRVERVEVGLGRGRAKRRHYWTAA